jgi:hypothetical protein
MEELSVRDQPLKPFQDLRHLARLTAAGEAGAVGLPALCPVVSEEVDPAHASVTILPRPMVANLATLTPARQRTAQHPLAQLTETGATGANGVVAL